MNEIKSIIAKNISELRLQNSMTQIELAQKLNYSDKAVSKWERGESIPDIGVLTNIADLFGVPLDYLVRAEHTVDYTETQIAIQKENKARRIKNRGLITGISVILVWLAATIVFAVIDMAIPDATAHWLCFAYAVPISFVIWLIFNSIWFKQHRNYLIVSLLVWTLLFALFVTFLAFGPCLWQLFIVGIPAEIIIMMCSRLSFRKTAKIRKTGFKQLNSDAKKK